MRRKILITLIVLFCIVFCVSGYMVGSQLIRERRDINAFDELADLKHQAAIGTTVYEGTSSDKNDAAEPEEDPAPEEGDPQESGDEITQDEDGYLPQSRVLFERNEDFFAWLSIEGTTIDYPVMYTPDRPEYYLRRGYDKSYSYSGVPFMDEDCDPDGNLYLIYGHNMRNNTMFAKLFDYLDQGFCSEHSLIRFDTLTQERTYTVMAVVLTQVYPEDQTGVFRYYAYTGLKDEETFDRYVKNVKALSAVKTDVEAQYGDELLVLSTCSYHVDDGRLIVVAKRVS